MKNTLNTSGINVMPPITQISVNKFNVAFEDGKSKQFVNLKSSIEAKRFVSWLLSI
ncbi:hypothetical protein [Aestuariibacter sp. GS-14]|uniref:hypothetical protein n=1 Tax=Alteromonadaceae TaxID=72275 RepID=UPI0015E84D53|nr:hypothetical protein [Aestuariibacter sp. GS-14]